MNNLQSILAEKQRIQEARLQAEIRAYSNMRKQTNKPLEALARREGQYDKGIKQFDVDIELRKVTRLSTQGKKRASQKRRIVKMPCISINPELFN